MYALFILLNQNNFIIYTENPLKGSLKGCALMMIRAAKLRRAGPGTGQEQVRSRSGAGAGQKQGRNRAGA